MIKGGSSNETGARCGQPAEPWGKYRGMDGGGLAEKLRSGRKVKRGGKYAVQVKRIGCWDRAIGIRAKGAADVSGTEENIFGTIAGRQGLAGEKRSHSQAVRHPPPARRSHGRADGRGRETLVRNSPPIRGWDLVRSRAQAW
jgi:hypothetical protein